MSKGAEEAALKAYPIQGKWVGNQYGEWDGDINQELRKAFLQGYEQAEKDIIALIESRISEILGDAQPKPALRAELQELIKRIKEEEKWKQQSTFLTSFLDRGVDGISLDYVLYASVFLLNFLLNQY